MSVNLVYLIYLLRQSRERVGRVSVLLLWSIVATVSWFAEPPLLLYVAIHAGMVWLVRSLFFYSSIFSSLADLGLSVLAVAAGLWATLQAGSLLLAFWRFVLVQALFVARPEQMKPKAKDQPKPDNDRFERAHRSAELALRKFSSNN